MDNEAGRQKSSWTKRLSQKLKRRTTDHNATTTSTTSIEHGSSQNPFARNYVPQRAPASRGMSLDKGKRSATNTRPGTSQSETQTVLEDDFLGLDMRGRAIRRSSAASNRTGQLSIASSSSFARNSVPLSPTGPTHTDEPRTLHARDYVAPPSGQLVRKSQDAGHTRSSKEHSRLSLLNPFNKHVKTDDGSKVEMNQIHAIRRKEVPAPKPENNQALVANRSTTRSEPPIYHQFRREELPTPSGPMNHARKLLAGESITPGTTHPNTAAPKRSAFDSPEALSPASFVSAEDSYFGAQSLPNCADIKDQEHPTAEEVVEKSKYNSADTTVHQRVLPAVTHETIQRQEHHIVTDEITRDIHNYHHIHRILPVHDVEILPAKHYRMTENGLMEMGAEEVPQSRIDAWQSAIIPKIAV